MVTALLGIPPQQFKLFMDSIIWAIKHTMRDIADTGLNRKFDGTVSPVLTDVLLSVSGSCQ